MQSETQYPANRETESTQANLGSYALTRSQELIWLGQQLSPDIPLYNMVFTFEFKKHIDYEKFKRAFDITVENNAGLRNVFTTAGQSPRQHIARKLDYNFKLVRFDNSPDPIHSCKSWTNKQKLKKLEIDQCCFDSHLLKLSDQHYIWYLNQHHLVTDVWSSTLVYKLVVDIYLELEQQFKPSLDPTVSITQYHDFENRHRKQHVRIAQGENSRVEPVNLNFYGCDFTHDQGQTKRLSHVLTTKQSDGLISLADNTSIATFSQPLTLFNIYLTVICAYLNRVTNLSTATIGIPIHNRTQKNHRQTIGLFVELFPITVAIDDNATFEDLYQSVCIASQALLQQAGPGLSECEDGKRFNVVLNYIHVDFAHKHSFSDAVEWVHCDYSDPAHALRVHVCRFNPDQPARILFDINQALWQNARRPDIADHFTRLFDAFVTNPVQQISKIALGSAEDKAFLLTQYNKPFIPVPENSSQNILKLFKKSVSRHADKTAIIDGGNAYSYSLVDELSDQLCHELMSAGVNSGDLVGIHTQRCVELIVAILATHKTGAGYIPIEQNLPSTRIKYITEQSGLKLILTMDEFLPFPADLSINTRLIDLNALEETNWDPSNRQADIRHADTAYVMYTSGSTGQPKGVVISHRALYAYVCWATNNYTRNQPKCFPLYSSIGFDLTVTSIFVPLCSGGSIRIYRNESQTVDLSIMDVIEENKVDIVKLTPAHLELIDNQALETSDVETFIVGGEDFKTTLAKRIDARFNGKIKLINEYGPTEATVGCMIHTFNSTIDQQSSVPIGVPADHTRIYLLDEGLNPLPPGINGEIYIAGSNLADGYLNQPELTAESFIEDPFYAGEKMYKTGDLARWQENNKLVYLSRKDDQFKFRGIRIEKSEIEHALNSHPKISVSHLSLLKANSNKTHELRYCEHCGIASNYPNLRFDKNGICNLCLDYEQYHDKADKYFSDLDCLQQLLRQRASQKTGDYDCLMLFSGGKDSTYALYQLSEMGLSIYAMTLDNGFISDSAKSNIQLTVDKLGIDHEFATTAAMNDIFVESLKQHCSVCYGCFKTIYTLALNIAKEKGIPCIVTGLSRGQFFETRLTKDSFEAHSFDPQQIDNEVLNARKIYHRLQDTVTQRLAGRMFDNDTIFDKISFIDFYRYCDVSLSEIYNFLENQVPWIRPQDTGRSTNCLINDTGIYYHKQLQGYHNYALPYSWDVRLGLKTRKQAMDELDDAIDVRSVTENLEKIGLKDIHRLTDSESDVLAAYYVSDEEISTNELRDFLSGHLVQTIIPRYFTRLNTLPLTANGKIDSSQLPDPRTQTRKENIPLIKASTALEKTLVSIFTQVLQLEKIGIQDNYFDLGGDSIKAIQIAAQASQFGLRVKPSQLFDHQTIQELAAVIGNENPNQVNQSSVQGEAALTPIQRWFFRQPESGLTIFNHSVHLELNEKIPLSDIQSAVNKLIDHHDALRHRYITDSGERKQVVTEKSKDIQINSIIVDFEMNDELLASIEQDLHERINIANGTLMSSALIQYKSGAKDLLIMVIHHLGVDAVSWQILLEDLDLLFKQIHQRHDLLLPLKTTAFLDWANFLNQYKNSTTHLNVLNQLPDANQFHQVILRSARSSLKQTAVASVVVELPATLNEALSKLAIDKIRIPIHKTLLAALAYCLGKFCEQDSLCINVESHGRYDLDDSLNVTRTLGWFTSINPICLTVGSDPLKHSLARLIGQIDSQSDSAFHRFIESEHRETSAENYYSNVLFNYFGEHLAASYQEFSIKRPLNFIRSEHTQLHHAIEVNVFNDERSFRIECTYDPGYLAESRLRQLLYSYQADLESISSSINIQAQTLTDFSIDSLTDVDFTAIQKQLK